MAVDSMQITGMYLDGYCIREPAAFIHVSGDDAARFLQGQFSNDLRGCKPGTPPVYGLWLDSRAHIGADGFVARNSDGSFCIISYHSPASALCEKLERFIIADDVVLEDKTNAYRIVSLLGDAAHSAQSAAKAHLIWNGRHGQTPAIDVLISASDAELWREALHQEGLAGVSADDLRALHIWHGIPAIPHEVGSAETPAETGLDTIAVSFNKGCFIGQEVVARQRLTDRSIRTLCKVEWNSAADLPALPCPIVTESGQTAGELRAAVKIAGSCYGLAMVKRKYAESALFLTVDGANTSLTLGAATAQ